MVEKKEKDVKFIKLTEEIIDKVAEEHRGLLESVGRL